MTHREQTWMAMGVALALLASGCIVGHKRGDAGSDDGGDGGSLADAGDAGADAGDPCDDEGRFFCGAMTRQCCGGRWISYSDGPCWPSPDAGARDGSVLDCAASPTSSGCPCTAPVAPICGGFGPWRECIGGVWTLSATHACCL